MCTVLHRCVYVAWSCINITAQETSMIRTCFERLEDSANALYKCQKRVPFEIKSVELPVAMSALERFMSTMDPLMDRQCPGDGKRFAATRMVAYIGF